MLIEVKEPSAVIPLTEYERLKKIEDKYKDDIESLRLSYEDSYKGALERISEDENFKLVIFKIDPKYNMEYVARRMSSKEYEKLLEKRTELPSISTPQQTVSLYDKVFGNPFKK